MTRKKDPCPCGSGKKYADCCLKLKKEKDEIKIDPERQRELLEKLEEASKKTAVEFEEFCRGKDLPRQVLIYEFLMKRFREGREKEWDSEKVGAMSTEDIVEKLRSLQVTFNAEEFKRQALNATSAIDVAEDHYYTQDFKAEGFDEDFIWLAIVELWKRLLPDHPCGEMVDDLIFDGRQSLKRGDREEAVGRWERAWELIKKMVPSTLTSVEEAEEFIPHLDESLLWWCETFVEELYEAGLEKQEYLQTLIQVVDEVCERFPDSQALFVHIRVKKGRAHSALGDTEKAEALFETLVKEAPENMEVYLEWGDTYMEMKTPDYEKAERVYKMGMKNCSSGRGEIYKKFRELKALNGSQKK